MTCLKDAAALAEKTPVSVRLTVSTVDRYRKTRTFTTLRGARAFAVAAVGPAPEYSSFGYAVDSSGTSKLEWDGCAFSDLFPAMWESEMYACREASFCDCARCASEREELFDRHNSPDDDSPCPCPQCMHWRAGTKLRLEFLRLQREAEAAERAAKEDPADPNDIRF